MTLANYNPERGYTNAVTLYNTFIDIGHIEFLNDIIRVYGDDSEVFVVVYYNLVDSDGIARKSYHTTPIIFPASDLSLGLYGLQKHLHPFIIEVFKKTILNVDFTMYLNYLNKKNYQEYLEALKMMGKFKICIVRNTETQYQTFSNSSSRLEYKLQVQ